MKNFNSIIQAILESHDSPNSLCSFDAQKQFQSAGSQTCRLNAAFLITIAGDTHPCYNEATDLLQSSDNDLSLFLRNSIDLIESEITNSVNRDTLKTTADYCMKSDKLEWNDATRKELWPVFFPEGVSCIDNRKDGIDRLRKKRSVTITEPNSQPLSDPSSELLFTSNILLTMPASEEKLDQAGLPDKLSKNIRSILSEDQIYWFDHPIQIGVETDKNEVIYGLRGLNSTCAYEKERGNMKPDAKATCVLSVSVTHKGLQKITKEYLESEFSKIEPLEHLNVYIFTERETNAIIDDILQPAAKAKLPDVDVENISKVFGVDGEYGRHYSFLKAIAALWNVTYDKTVQATFKIDLDQVFPQEVLTEITGQSAFEHYMSPLWGAKGTDANGNKVELGMIAGALVNEYDIGDGLYSPDVKFPESIQSNEGIFFMSGLPMAFSTEAEMGTRYGKDGIDGTAKCIQRVHVTGGTNGITIDALRKYRPFTPSFIGRAEDQAYLMSVLYSQEDSNLRYLHSDGLIMRHDKYAFAGEAIEAAQIGRQTGDLVRLLYFSSYAQALPWPLKKTKDALDPFTGCFISKIPITIVMFRLCVSIAAMFEASDPLAEELSSVAVKRVGKALDNLDLTDDYQAERSAWNNYYDILDVLEQDNDTMSSIRAKATDLINSCQIGKH